jgi:hypothetical protein
VTIDLEAETTGRPDPAASEPVGESEPVAGSETVAASRPHAGDGGAERESEPRAAARIGAAAPALLLAGVAGGVVALALGYGLQFAGVVPSPVADDIAQTRTEVAGVTETVSALDQRLTSVEAANAQSIADRALLDDLSKQVGVVDAFGTSLSDRLLAAEASIAALEEQGDDNSGGADKQQLDDVTKRVAQLEAAPPVGDDPSAQLAQLAARVAALESAAASDQAAAAAQPEAALPGESGPAADTAAIDALRQAATGSRPFAAELAQLGDGVIAPATKAALLPLAEKGVPTRAALIAEFPAVAAAIVADEPAADSDGGLLGLVATYSRALVTVRPAGSQSDAETEAVVSQMRAAVAAGDLAKALAARDELPPQGRTASKAWAAAVAERLEIERLVDDIPDAAQSGGGSG